MLHCYSASVGKMKGAFIDGSDLLCQWKNMQRNLSVKITLFQAIPQLLFRFYDLNALKKLEKLEEQISLNIGSLTWITVTISSLYMYYI